MYTLASHHDTLYYSRTDPSRLTTMSSAADLSGQLQALPTPTSDPRKLAAFVHADVVGYSALVGRDDAGTSSMLADIRLALIDPALSRFGGRVVNTAGDSLLME